MLNLIYQKFSVSVGAYVIVVICFYMYVNVFTVCYLISVGISLTNPLCNDYIICLPAFKFVQRGKWVKLILDIAAFNVQVLGNMGTSFKFFNL